MLKREGDVMPKHEHQPGTGRDARGRAVCVTCRRKIVDGMFGWRLA